MVSFAMSFEYFALVKNIVYITDNILAFSTWAEPPVWQHHWVTLCSWRGWPACLPAAGSAPSFPACSGRCQTSGRRKWSRACGWRWPTPSRCCVCPPRWSQLFDNTTVWTFQYSYYIHRLTTMHCEYLHMHMDCSSQYHRYQRGCSILDTHIHTGWRSSPFPLAGHRKPAPHGSLWLSCWRPGTHT